MVDKIKNKHNNIVHTLCLLPSMVFIFLNCLFILLRFMPNTAISIAAIVISVSILCLFFYLYNCKKLLINYAFYMSIFFAASFSAMCHIFICAIFFAYDIYYLQALALYVLLLLVIYISAFYNKKIFYFFAGITCLFTIPSIPLCFDYYLSLIEDVHDYFYPALDLY